MTDPKANTREKELKDFIKKTLEANGELTNIRAALRLKTMNVLRKSKKTPMTNFTAHHFQKLNCLNDLILEYFRWIGFSYSAEIFSAEIGRDSIVADRHYLEEQLPEITIDKDVPILINLLKSFLNFE